jgi:hypothetical protein
MNRMGWASAHLITVEGGMTIEQFRDALRGLANDADAVIAMRQSVAKAEAGVAAKQAAQAAHEAGCVKMRNDAQAVLKQADQYRANAEAEIAKKQQAAEEKAARILEDALGVKKKAEGRVLTAQMELEAVKAQIVAAKAELEDVMPLLERVRQQARSLVSAAQ